MSKEFGQNLFGNSFDFAAMDKYTKTKCCLEKRSPDILTYGILKMAHMDKCCRANVAWTNVTVTVDIC